MLHADIDREGDLDIIDYTYNGSNSSAFWEQNPGDPVNDTWTNHTIGTFNITDQGEELWVARIDGSAHAVPMTFIG